MKYEMNIVKIAPVLFGFFVMGFCDVVGITVSHVKEELLGAYNPEFRDTLSNLVPVALFSMFLIFSIPTGFLMNRFGRKNTVIISNVITTIAMFIPLIQYSFIMTLIAFVLLGIANTIIQVALNPLLTNVVSGDRLTSSLTAGQFVKAISSFSAPFIAYFAAAQLNNWQYIFPIYAVITIFSTIWLMSTPIQESEINISRSSYSDILNLLKDKTILLLFLGIVFVVGVDVGMNTAAPKLLIDRTGLNSIDAGYGTSVYFALRTLGTFLGAVFLAKYSSIRFFKINIIMAITALIVLIFTDDKFILFGLYGIIGFTIANIFPIIFGTAIQIKPDKVNEISGLMITGVVGGAIIPFFMGMLTDIMKSQTGAVLVILISTIYLLFAALIISKKIKSVQS